jgi:hypothetical protein
LSTDKDASSEAEEILLQARGSFSAALFLEDELLPVFTMIYLALVGCLSGNTLKGTSFPLKILCLVEVGLEE